MSALEISLIVVCSILAIIFIVVRTIKGSFIAFVLKTLASLGFVVSGIIALGLSNSNAWVGILIVVGLLLGMIGDMVLDLKVIYPDNDRTYLNMGMASFFLGHCCYIGAFTIFASDTNLLMPILVASGVAILLTILTTLSGKKMGLDFGNYLVQTIVYTFILSFALAYTFVLAIVGGGLWLTAIGLMLFLLSDIVLSCQYFGGKIASKPYIAINHTLYYAAQIILLAVLFVL
ncbi:MAG: lysoplasmalogenase family protein [Christensenellales bacterium]